MCAGTNSFTNWRYKWEKKNAEVSQLQRHLFTCGRSIGKEREKGEGRKKKCSNHRK